MIQQVRNENTKTKTCDVGAASHDEKSKHATWEGKRNKCDAGRFFSGSVLRRRFLSISNTDADNDSAADGNDKPKAKTP